jgi:hypothetical protein
LAAVLGVVGDTPLDGGEEMLGDGTPQYEDLLMELVESRGGGSDLLLSGSPLSTRPASTLNAYEPIMPASSSTTRTKTTRRTSGEARAV